ncbi:MAG TPA: hypothetical protein ENK05_06595 [Gammaproteobacteria bacterium]|nr:hypothetical protein [Gammaproteobacteria bacterium]
MLLLGGAVLLLWRYSTRLRARLAARSAAGERFDSVDSGYLPYLEKEWLDSSRQLEQLAAGDSPDEDLAAALQRRIELLAAEKRLAELCNDYPERRWEHVLEQFRPPAPGETPEEQLPAEAAEDVPAAAEERPYLTGLQRNHERQGDALQVLRETIVRLQERPDEELVGRLEKEFAELERRYREAGSCIEILKQENDRLQMRVERKDQRIDQVEGERNETVSELEDKLGQQKRSIAELHELVGALQLEEEKAAELQTRLEQFDLAARDMNMCIQVLEEENQFLQEQIRSLLHIDEGESLYRKRDESATETGEN